MADAIFEHPRLARIYDDVDGDRRDLDEYVAIVDALRARSVLDLGCGTGAFACLLAGRGVDVTAVDPAAASLEVARQKPNAARVRWLLGDATTLPPLRVDLATMTGNVAQVFLADDEWAATVHATHDALRPGGHLVFETRDPAFEGWRAWNRVESYQRFDLPRAGPVETWVDVTDVALPFVSFRATFVFGSDGAVLRSSSTLRFRSRAEIAESLLTAGFSVEDVRDAPDRPGAELVFVARRSDT
ncbi:MAG TPA: class I SAM-dependent methyltransferase [Acidimicrobiia bacterium]